MQYFLDFFQLLRDLHQVAAPLSYLTYKDKLQWNKEAKVLFDVLKKEFIFAPIFYFF